MKDSVIKDFLLLVYEFASGRGEQEENEIILNDNDFSVPITSLSRVLVILEKSLKFLVISQWHINWRAIGEIKWKDKC